VPRGYRTVVYRTSANCLATGIVAQNYLQKLIGAAPKATEALPLLADLLHPDRWLLWLGVLFVLSVYFFPTGIVGKLRQG
jgi:branched-chain amino acid transport system permease protein